MERDEKLVQRLLDGEFSPGEKKDILDRLESDPSLLREFITLRETVRVIEKSPRLAPPASFAAGVLDRLPEGRQPLPERFKEFFFARRMLRWNMAAATAAALMLLVLGAALFLYQPGKGGITMNGTTVSGQQAVTVRFRLYAPHARTVALAGEFNKWKVDETALIRQEDGAWVAELSLEPGTYTYMFVVNGKEWVPDPDADSYRDDGFGYKNSVLRVSTL
ncbi:MAG: isoamylase early set domain-containing protein [Nitrospirota bacterium]